MTDTRWPKPLSKAAFHGVLGDIVQAIAPQTEADVCAVLIQIIVMLGNLIGRSPHFRVGEDTHHLNLFAAIVGATGKGRKGVSYSQSRSVGEAIDPEWMQTRENSGLSSGEGLIWAIRDPIKKEQAIRQNGRVVGYETVVEDPGILDKRLLVVETEFSSVLKVMHREGNTLSDVVRKAWDGKTLATLTKNSPARATAPYISILAHTTAEDLQRHLDVTETANGFGNRFLWILAKRSRELPDGGARVDLTPYLPRLTHAVDAARRRSELRRDEETSVLWRRIYGPLSTGRPGMLGAMTARAEAIVMRLACLYALADDSSLVRLPHLQAAREIWRYAFQSVAYLFGDRLGDATADAILAALRRVWPESLTRTEISDVVFHHHKPASEIDRALGVLSRAGLAKSDTDRSGEGRPTERWVACEREFSEISEPSDRDSSLNSPISPSQADFAGGPH